MNVLPPIPASVVGFDFKQLLATAGASFLTDSALQQNLGLNKRKSQAVARAVIADGLWQSGFLVGEVASMLATLKIEERTSVRAGFYAVVFTLGDMMMKERVGIGTTLIQAVGSAYGATSLEQAGNRLL